MNKNEGSRDQKNEWKCGHYVMVSKNGSTGFGEWQRYCLFLLAG